MLCSLFGLLFLIKYNTFDKFLNIVVFGSPVCHNDDGVYGCLGRRNGGAVLDVDK